MCAIVMREATSETYGPGSTFLTYCFPIYLFASLFSDLQNQKPKIYYCTFYLPFIFCVLERSISPIYHYLIYLFTVERLTTSLLCWVESICYLCAGAAY